jgi:hypothetical protein
MEMIKPSNVMWNENEEEKRHNKMNASIYCNRKRREKKVVTRDQEENQTEDRVLFTDT